ncbi:carboxymuconolactone decarboxylase family protein [Zeaxanthinibacter sp. PT1]|uniref:carboxymuconolactone decarboxylase family protein n=1 Tax=Zeaxanthinibacter TaxID=561554 RepID=UPI00234AED5B|nr:carboxymuconolactone decarboxylase family protein [Zeaxanthinibacter sp. PT1]MDC6352198.1 carboxymuconolactone decarboxylase family protein [Zeaxanthinibacter sp. PT1]
MSDKTYQIGLSPVTLETADEKQKNILEQAKKANGMIPNMYNNMVNLPGLQETYDLGYQKFRSESGFTPAEQEVVFITLSVDNGCNYCTAAHSFIADKMSKTPEEVTDAIRDGKEIPGEKYAALVKFTKIMNRSKGNPSPSEAREFLAAGFREKQILAIILAQSVKTISNYSNHIFHTEVDDAFSSRKVTEG